MAHLIETPCWLVPIPASDGSTRANSILASPIARHRRGVQIAQASRRAKPIESQCARHRCYPPPTPTDAHLLKATLWSLGHRQIYFVDNVATSGNTMRAAYATMKRPKSTRSVCPRSMSLQGPGQFWNSLGFRHLSALNEARRNRQWDEIWLAA